MQRVLLILAGVVVLAGVPVVLALTSEPESADAAPVGAAEFDSRFVGTWELVSYVTFRESGEAIDNNYIARIIYDEFGNMAGIGMPRDLHERPRAADGTQQRSGFAYFSWTELRADEGYVIHHVVGSPLTPSWVGSGQVRYFEFEDDLLKLSLREDDRPDGRITGTLTWRRMNGPAGSI